MEWKAIADLALAGLGNVLVLVMMAVVSCGLALKLLTLLQPAVARRKRSEPANTAPRR